MGSWLGHTAPGTFFIVFSIWWIIQFSYHNCRNKLMSQCRLVRYLSQRPCEGISLVIVAFVGVFGENMLPAPKWQLIDETGQFVHQNVWQHCTMYVYFGLYGVIQIIGFRSVSRMFKYAPAFGSLAYGTEALLFYYHVHGRNDLDVHIHMLLVLAISVCSVSAFLEYAFPDDVIFRITRITFTMVQGTWFWMIGTVLYKPPSGEPWDPVEHENLMFITAAFTWHILAAMAVFLIVYCIMYTYMLYTGHRTMGIAYHPIAKHSACHTNGADIGSLDVGEQGSDFE